MKVLNNETDFLWYKRELDLSGKYEYKHIGKPYKYPCKIQSEVSDEPNGPYMYDHEFIYEQEIECEKCGHTKKIWPNI